MKAKFFGEKEEILQQKELNKKKKLNLQNARKQKGDHFISISQIEKISKECVTWEEARPYVNLLHEAYSDGMPSTVKQTIKRIKKIFEKKMYPHSNGADHIVFNHAQISAPLYSVKKNKNVKLVIGMNDEESE